MISILEELKLAREMVNQHKQGTPEWEDAMQLVRALCKEIKDTTHTEGTQ